MKAIWLAAAMFMAIFVLEAIHYTQVADEFRAFTAKGPRFTAADGQALCERIRALEKDPQLGLV